MNIVMVFGLFMLRHIRLDNSNIFRMEKGCGAGGHISVYQKRGIATLLSDIVSAALLIKESIDCLGEWIFFQS